MAAFTGFLVITTLLLVEPLMSAPGLPKKGNASIVKVTNTQAKYASASDKANKMTDYSTNTALNTKNAFQKEKKNTSANKKSVSSENQNKFNQASYKLDKNNNNVNDNLKVKITSDDSRSKLTDVSRQLYIKWFSKTNTKEKEMVSKGTQISTEYKKTMKVVTDKDSVKEEKNSRADMNAVKIKAQTQSKENFNKNVYSKGKATSSKSNFNSQSKVNAYKAASQRNAASVKNEKTYSQKKQNTFLAAKG